MRSSPQDLVTEVLLGVEVPLPPSVLEQLESLAAARRSLRADTLVRASRASCSGEGDEGHDHPGSGVDEGGSRRNDRPQDAREGTGREVPEALNRRKQPEGRAA